MMTVDITRLPLEELLDDKQASLADIKLCEDALKIGADTYGFGQSVKKRLKVNQLIVAKIDAELKRRGIE